MPSIHYGDYNILFNDYHILLTLQTHGIVFEEVNDALIHTK